jgi:hypothetical protein
MYKYPTFGVNVFWAQVNFPMKQPVNHVDRCGPELQKRTIASHFKPFGFEHRRPVFEAHG